MRNRLLHAAIRKMGALVALAVVILVGWASWAILPGSDGTTQSAPGSQPRKPLLISTPLEQQGQPLRQRPLVGIRQPTEMGQGPGGGTRDRPPGGWSGPVRRGIPIPDPAGVNAARQQLTMKAYLPVPGAGVIEVKYRPGWTAEVYETAIWIKAPNGFSGFEVFFGDLLRFMRTPDEVMEQFFLLPSRREVPDVQVVQKRAVPGPMPGTQYVSVGTFQGRRVFSVHTIYMIGSGPPMPGLATGWTTVHWVGFFRIPEDQPQPWLNFMEAMAQSMSEHLAGGGVQTPPIGGGISGGSGTGGLSGRTGETQSDIQKRCHDKAWYANRDAWLGRGGGYDDKQVYWEVYNSCMASGGR